MRIDAENVRQMTGRAGKRCGVRAGAEFVRIQQLLTRRRQRNDRILADRKRFTAAVDLVVKTKGDKARFSDSDIQAITVSYLVEFVFGL